MTRLPLHQRVLTEEERQRIANREVERQRVAAIFQPTGGLNLPAIRLLIAWAEEDIATLGDYRLWGTWDQGHWGHADLPLDPPTLAVVRLDAYDEVQERAEAFDVMDKAVLNGACQTAYCMAGQAVVQAGHKMLYDSVTADTGTTRRLSVTADTCVRVEPTGRFDDKGYPMVREVGAPRSISETAAEILGLDSDQEDLFFSGSNDVDQLKAYANHFAREDGQALPYPDHEVWGEDDDEPEDDFS